MNTRSNQNNTTNSRQARHKQGLSKKTGLGIFIVFVIILIGSSVYASYAMQATPEPKKPTEETPDHYEQKEAALLEKIRETQKNAEPKSTEQTKQADSIQILTYEPIDSIPQLSTIITERDALIEASRKNSNEEIAKIVGRIKMEKVSEQVTSYHSIVETYHWVKEKNEWTEQTEAGKNVLFINQQTQQPLTLKDIFTDKANILAVQQVIQQKLLSESPDGNAVIDSVLNMPAPSLDTTAFTYYADKITLALPENATGKHDITLPYNEIAGYVNPDLIALSSIKEALPTPLDPNKKYISLTFDDGPNPETTPRLLKILKEKGVKATFFMLGQNVAKNEALVKQISEEGHEIASHSYSHPQLTTIDAQKVKEEVQKTDKAIYQATGKLPSNFRPPYGAVNSEVAAIIGKPIIQWSVDSQDWQSHNAEAINKRIDETAYNDTIVLMHDIHPETIDAVPAVIDRLHAEGYEILPSNELLGKKAKPLHMYYGSKDERPVP